MSNKMTRDPLYFRSASIRRRAIRSILARAGLSYSRASNRDEVLAFFQMLWPVEVNGGLIRIGPDGDGGYLIPKMLGDFDVIFSPGIANNWDFEKAYLHYQPNTRVYMADGSVEKDSLGVLPPTAEFIKKFVGLDDSGETVSVESWICERYAGSNALMSMDIEGQEYEILGSLPDSVLGRFKCIVIELHGLQLVGSREGLAFLNSVFRRLKSMFHVAHLHVNNYANPVSVASLTVPSVVELTLARKDSVRSQVLPVDVLPHPLDRPNCKKPEPKFFPHFRDGVLRTE